MLSEKIPKFELEGKKFPLGRIPDMIEVAKWQRAVMCRSAEGWYVGDIWSFPSSWVSVMDMNGMFGTLETLICEAHLKGSASKKVERPQEIGEEFDLDKRLAEEGIAQLKVGKGVIIYIGKVIRSTVRYNRAIHGPTNILKLRIAATLHPRLEDAIVKYIYVNAGDMHSLWAPYPRRKIGQTGSWDNFAEEIMKINKAFKGKIGAVASMDLWAIHESADWLNTPDMAKEAILNAYDSDYVKDKIKPLFKGMPANELITSRRESKVESVLPVEYEFPFRTTEKKKR